MIYQTHAAHKPARKKVSSQETEEQYQLGDQLSVAATNRSLSQASQSICRCYGGSNGGSATAGQQRRVSNAFERAAPGAHRERDN